jgi:tetratricopeptide (TPR) repeat protein
MSREAPDSLAGRGSKATASRGSLLPYLLVAAAAFACYANTLRNGFCYDSVEIVEMNPMVVEPGHWFELWTVDHWYQGAGETANRDLLYRPVSLLTYRLVHAIGGPPAFAQHLVNVLLHVLISLLLVRFARILGAGTVAAGAVGLLFAVLPIHTEAVADVVGRAELLATLGVLLALFAHRRSMIASSSGGTFLLRFAAAVAVFGALGAKEIGISALALILLFDAYWLANRRTKTGEAGWWRLSTVARLWYLLIPALVYFILRYNALGGVLHQKPAVSKTVNLLIEAPAWQHALGVLQIWGMYWAKTFAPVTLCIDYSVNAVRLATSILNGHVLFGTGVAAALVLWSIVAWRRGDRRIALLAGAIGVSYFPVSNAVILIQVFFAERVWYLPSVWVLLLVAPALGLLLKRRVGQGLLAVVVLAMMGRCWIRNAEWKDNGTLFAAAYRDHPQGVGPLLLYGRWIGFHGHYQKGVELIERALTIDPGYTDAHRALGQLHLTEGNLEKALQHLKIAQMQFPGHKETEEALQWAGEALSKAAEDELEQLRLAAAANPANLDLELALVAKLRDLARYDEALARLAAAESRFASYAAFQREYAVTLVMAGRRDEAIERYRQCVKLAHDDGTARVELAALLMERQANGDLAEAERMLEAAEAVAPDLDGVLILRAKLLALKGDLDGAVALYRRLIQALPQDSELRQVLREEVKKLGGD